MVDENIECFKISTMYILGKNFFYFPEKRENLAAELEEIKNFTQIGLGTMIGKNICKRLTQIYRHVMEQKL